ncbi:uncharacterized protein BKCO1_200026 [Diplodia corticola]|uniref:Uncharacterized protein n=1 Tax=Diplodia corticola TaxID=236234 RepID=A0A1J9S4K9_9PEZI|nr:uncharacterized protein BKCO1_200026 [Diplodia corticola]OJD39891.1 hypothetical protein BKCO1_200026 [Diplodia corticola]
MAHNAGASPTPGGPLHHEHKRKPIVADEPAAPSPPPRSPARRPSSAHKRSVSASILSKLPFLRNPGGDLPAAAHVALAGKEDPRARDDGPLSLGAKRSGASMALAHAVRQSAANTTTAGRRRRGSLRKTAILGTRQRSSESALHKMDPIATSPTSPEQRPATLAPRPFTYANPSAASSSESGWSGMPPAKPTSLHETTTTPRSAVLASPISSPVSSPVANPYASTTDDDNDSLTFRRPSSPGGPGSGANGHNGHLSPSYFPMQALSSSSLLQQRRRTAVKTNSSTTRHSSPLSLPPATTTFDLVDEWDYSETEWWGWVVLIVTWIVFVIGMGSCLEVWSWAWDVGETPYAPPELEDDPTLPIVGYYPALMVLTAVMAWVWVVVAWVGMKYFRHAKVVGDDG